MTNNDYITRRNAMNAACSDCYCCETIDEFEDTTCPVKQKFMSIPAADVEPKRKPGRWVSKEGIYGVVYCSICDFELKIDNTPYCPNCGAKMFPEPPKEGQK